MYNNNNFFLSVADDFYDEEDNDIWGPHNATVGEILRGGDEEIVRRLLNITIPRQS